MGQNFYAIKFSEDVIAEKVREDYVPVIVKALMSECFADPNLTIEIIRDNDWQKCDDD